MKTFPLMNLLSLNAFIKTFALIKVPLLGLLRPKVIHLDESASVVSLPHGPLSRNHVGSMYFGALAIGAELSVALAAVDRIRQGDGISFIFKDFSCEFHRRAEEETQFCCLETKGIYELINLALATGDRVEGRFSGFAIPASQDWRQANESDFLMSYKISLSIKKQ